MPKKNADGQVELVLENRQLLVIFFVIVALCGVFFSLGYIVGRNTSSVAARSDPAAPESAGASKKPSPMPPAAFANQTPDSSQSAAAPSPAVDLNLSQSAGKGPDAKLQPSETSPGEAPPAASRAPAAEKQPAPEPAAGILIQVSALTHRQDADTLVALLKEKKLPVMVTSAPNDPLFHVVVGPYKTEKEAQAAKALLESDGFRPIIKR